MSDCQFKEISESDLPEVRSIYTHYVLNSTATFHAIPPSIEEMRDLLISTDNKYKTFVLVSDGTLCGYVLTARHKNREAYDTSAEVSVYLRPDFTCKGLGSKAVQHIFSHAKSQGLHVLIATISGPNIGSIRLFEKSGFEKCAHYKEIGRKFGQWLDVVAYQKIIS